MKKMNAKDIKIDRKRERSYFLLPVGFYGDSKKR